MKTKGFAKPLRNWGTGVGEWKEPGETEGPAQDWRGYAGAEGPGVDGDLSRDYGRPLEAEMTILGSGVVTSSRRLGAPSTWTRKERESRPGTWAATGDK